MGKHLGEPSARRTPTASRGLLWGVAGFLALNVVAVIAVVQGLGAHHQPTDAISTAAHQGQRTAAARTGSSASGGHSGGHHRGGHTAPPATVVRQVPFHRAAGKELRLRPAVAHARWQARQPTVFRVSTFNLLGASHTGLGGNHKGFATGARRMVNAVDLLRSFQVDVVGFQEMEPVQWATFNRLTGHGWGTFPGPTLDRGSIRQSIAWRLDTWQLVSTSSIAIPYFHGMRIRMPIVLLANIRTGQQVYFANFHNPATTPSHGNNQRWRYVAEAEQVAMVRRLQAQSPGTPIIITGDMNERAEYFAHLAGQTDMCPANAAVTSPGVCYMPRRMDVDWIFGSPDISFSGYVSDQGPFVRRTTDHPIVVATGTLAPAIDRR